MATFKVGDRVKRVRDTNGEHMHPASRTEMPIGATGTVVEAMDVNGFVRVLRDGAASWRDWGCQAHTLEPLTPPAEDTWAADKVRQVTKPQHMEPVAPEKLPALDEVMNYYRSLGGS